MNEQIYLDYSDDYLWYAYLDCQERKNNPDALSDINVYEKADADRKARRKACIKQCYAKQAAEETLRREMKEYYGNEVWIVKSYLRRQTV